MLNSFDNRVLTNFNDIACRCCPRICTSFVEKVDSRVPDPAFREGGNVLPFLFREPAATCIQTTIVQTLCNNNLKGLINIKVF